MVLSKMFNHVSSKFVLAIQSVLTFVTWREEFNEWLRLVSGIVAFLVGLFALFNYHYKTKLNKELYLAAKQDREERKKKIEDSKDRKLKTDDDEEQLTG